MWVVSASLSPYLIHGRDTQGPVWCSVRAGDGAGDGAAAETAAAHTVAQGICSFHHPRPWLGVESPVRKTWLVPITGPACGVTPADPPFIIFIFSWQRAGDSIETPLGRRWTLFLPQESGYSALTAWGSVA